MVTLEDMQATRKAVLDLSVITDCEEHQAERAFTYFNHFYIIVSVAPLVGMGLNDPDLFAVMYYCDVYNECCSSRDLLECEKFLHSRMADEMGDFRS